MHLEHFGYSDSICSDGFGGGRRAHFVPAFERGWRRQDTFRLSCRKWIKQVWTKIDNEGQWMIHYEKVDGIWSCSDVRQKGAAILDIFAPLAVFSRVTWFAAHVLASRARSSAVPSNNTRKITIKWSFLYKTFTPYSALFRKMTQVRPPRHVNIISLIIFVYGVKPWIMTVPREAEGHAPQELCYRVSLKLPFWLLIGSRRGPWGSGAICPHFKAGRSCTIYSRGFWRCADTERRGPETWRM